MQRYYPLALLTILGACARQQDRPPESLAPTSTADPTTPPATPADPTTELDGMDFRPVLEHVQHLADDPGRNQMHISDLLFVEARPDTDPDPAVSNGTPPLLLQCSRDFGLYNASDPRELTVLAEGYRHGKTGGDWRPGCSHIAADDDDRDLVFTTSRGGVGDGNGFLSGWKLNLTNAVKDADSDGQVDDPNRVQTTGLVEMKQECGDGVDNDGDGRKECKDRDFETLVSFEGLDVEDGIIWVTEHQRGLAAYEYDRARNRFTELGRYEGLENAWDVHVTGKHALVADGIGGVVALDVTNPRAPVELDRLVFDGHARDLRVHDGRAYVAAESGGVVIVDITDPTSLKVISVLDTGGSAIAVDYDDDRLYVAAWEDVRVYDVKDPAAPVIIGAARHTVGAIVPDETVAEQPVSDELPVTDRILAVAGRGNTLYAGNWWAPNLYDIHAKRVAPYIDLPETVARIVIPGDVPPGGTSTFEIPIHNAGTAPLTVHDAWTDGPGWVVTPTDVLVPVGGDATLTLTFTAAHGLDGTPIEESANIWVASDDPAQPLRQAFAVANADEIGVGDPFPETLVTLMDGGDWAYTKDALGSVTLVMYFATFCPVCSLEIPDVENALWQKYQDQGLKVIAIDSLPGEVAFPSEVASYFAALGPTYPGGIETLTFTYTEFESGFDGASPFPLDIIVDKQGIVRHVAREYDPVAMEAMIQSLL